MFSGICPCSPCDRTSPGASVSTLGSMTRRLRAGMGRRCRSGSPAPGHGQHRFNSSRKREGVICVPAHPPACRSCRAGPRSPVQSSSFKAVPELRGRSRLPSQTKKTSFCCPVPLRQGGGSDSKGAAARDSDLCAPRSGGQQRRPPAATAAAAERLLDSFPSLLPPSGSGSAGVSLPLSLSLQN